MIAHYFGTFSVEGAWTESNMAAYQICFLKHTAFGMLVEMFTTCYDLSLTGL